MYKQSKQLELAHIKIIQARGEMCHRQRKENKKKTGKGHFHLIPRYVPSRGPEVGWKWRQTSWKVAACFAIFSEGQDRRKQQPYMHGNPHRVRSSAKTRINSLKKLESPHIA
jgi:hypothetical protein